MGSLTYSIESLEIPFKQAFSHASATRTHTESVLVTVQSTREIKGQGEGCPRSYVTGESIETVQAFFRQYVKEWEALEDLQGLQAWVHSHQAAIDANPAGWCAVELASLDLFAKQQAQSIEAFLGLQELSGHFQYSAVLGAESCESFQKQAQRFSILGFSDFKVKVSGRLEEDQANISFLKKIAGPNLQIRLDANNLWTDPQEVVNYLQQLQFSFRAVEEPLVVNDYEGCRQINNALGIPIILDESFLRFEQFQNIQSDPHAWLINVRISKMGGILRSLAIADQAEPLGIPIVIGAQVGETSILTRAALTVANQYRGNLLAQEGAFGTYLLEHDIVDPPLMFGKNGVLVAQGLSPHLSDNLFPSS